MDAKSTFKPIYLDHQSTTPLDPRVLEAMNPYFSENYGNPASRMHAFGWKAEAAVDRARGILAAAIEAHPSEITFTSGGTESNNFALLGSAFRYEREQGKAGHIITTAVEHASVLEPLKWLMSRGFEVTVLPVDQYGRITSDQVEAAIKPNTFLVSVLFANNEIGTIQPIAEIGKVCKKHKIIFHVDAVQALGKFLISVQNLGIDLMSLNAHKNYGPKGIGALYIRRKAPRVLLDPILHGGGHENGLRSGTLNVPSIVGFGKAIELAISEMGDRNEMLRGLQKRFLEGILDRIDDVRLNGHPTDRLANNLNFTFDYVEAQPLLTVMQPIALSTGAACGSLHSEESHVLKAIGLSSEAIKCSVRIGLGKDNTPEEVQTVLDRLVESVHKLRMLSPILPEEARRKYDNAHRKSG